MLIHIRRDGQQKGLRLKNMISRENGKEYKVILDSFLSNLLGINFCVCIQWDSMTNIPGEIIYVRAYDKFSKLN